MPRRPGRYWFVAVVFAGVAATWATPIRAADVDAFLAGTSRNCAECDLAGRDLRERDFKRARLERANLSAADCTGATFFRAVLTRARLAGATSTARTSIWSMPSGRICRAPT